MENECSFIGHPAGFEIAERAFLYCHLPEGAKVLDIGCGDGATVNYLTEEFNLDIYGIDLNPSSIEKNEKIIPANAENIPFADSSFDGILMECSFSLMNNQERVLEECFRLLKENGYLVISDMFARGVPARFSGCLGRLDSEETIVTLIERSGFQVTMFVDYSANLPSLWGQLILKNGADSFYKELGTDPQTIKKIKCGYFLLIATKSAEN